MVTIDRYIKALLHPAGGHQGSHKAHQAGNQAGMWRYWSIVLRLRISQTDAVIIIFNQIIPILVFLVCKWNNIE